VPPSVSAPPNPNADSTAIDWWTPAKQTSRQATSRHPEPPPPADAPAGLPNIFVPTAFCLGEFVGQGRKMGYQGLAFDFLTSIYDLRQNPHTIKTIADKTSTKLNRCFKRPGAWLSLAAFSFLLFWWSIGMAFMVSYQTPTAGLACRSGSYLLYGILASIAWCVSLVRKNPGEKTRAACYLVNLLSCCALTMIVLAQVSVSYSPSLSRRLILSTEDIGHWTLQQLHLQMRLRRLHGLARRRILQALLWC
jgi:hypothetical protein